MSTTNEYFKKHGSRNPFPRMEFADGASMSVQFGAYIYCRPREDGAVFYTAVEVGFPSAREEALMPYAEDPSDPCETVYGYVPVEIVDEIIKRHGGLK